MAEAYLNSLMLPAVEALSSGSVAEERSEYTREVAKNTLSFLGQHGLAQYAKTHWDQLTQERVDLADVTVCLNKSARKDSKRIVELPSHTITWNVADWDEGDKPATTYAEWLDHTEDIFAQIKNSTDELVRTSVKLD